MNKHQTIRTISIVLFSVILIGLINLGSSVLKPMFINGSTNMDRVWYSMTSSEKELQLPYSYEYNIDMQTQMTEQLNDLENISVTVDECDQLYSQQSKNVVFSLQNAFTPYNNTEVISYSEVEPVLDCCFEELQIIEPSVIISVILN